MGNFSPEAKVIHIGIIKKGAITVLVAKGKIMYTVTFGKARIYLTAESLHSNPTLLLSLLLRHSPVCVPHPQFQVIFSDEISIRVV